MKAGFLYFHVHRLTPFPIVEYKGEKYQKIFPLYEKVRKELLRIKFKTNRRLNIITAIRDPVAYNVSGYFQSIQFFHPDINYRLSLGKKIPFEELKKRFISKFDHEYILKWFDHELLSPNNGEHILDSGIGFGRFSELIVKYKAKVTGVDISEKNIKHCYKKISKSFEGVIADLLEIPICNDTFDKVICIGVLVHVENPLAVLKELHRVLKPGGVIVIVNNNSLTYSSIFYKIVLALYDLLSKFNLLKTREYILRYKSPFWYNNLLRKVGFNIDEVVGDSFLANISFKSYHIFPPKFLLPFFILLDEFCHTTPFKYFCHLSVIRASKKNV